MTPAQAIRAATSDAAELLGRSEDLGTIQTGRFADIIAVSGNPLVDVRVLEQVSFVMKAGEVIKSDSLGVRKGLEKSRADLPPIPQPAK